MGSDTGRGVGYARHGRSGDPPPARLPARTLRRLATSLVADLRLISAATVWAITSASVTGPLSPEATSAVVSVSGGALFANVVSVVLLPVETVPSTAAEAGEPLP